MPAPRAARSLVQSFPGSPRPGQIDVLRALEAAWDTHDVFVLNLPVAFGKTKMAHAIQQWQLSRGVKSHLAVPTNQLAQQLRAEFPRLATLEKRDSYRCTSVREEAVMPDASCGRRHAAQGSHCSNCPYIKAVRTVHGVPVSASNYHTMLAHKIHKSVLIFDEAHLLLSVIREMEAVRIWLHDLPARVADAIRKVSTYEDLAELLRHEDGLGAVSSPAMRALKAQLDLGGRHWLVSSEPQLYRGALRDCLSLLPLDTRHSTKAGQLWPRSNTPGKGVQKIVLMSATLSEQDVAQLGLGGRRVAYFDGASPIPAERRPWRYIGAGVGSMGHKTQKQNLGRMVDALVELAGKYPGRKGLIHAPYALAALITPALTARLVGTHKVFSHTQGNKQAVFDAWQAHEGAGAGPAEGAARSPQGAVLVGSGMAEGVSLLGEQYAWQALTKVPFPSLAEPAYAWLAENEPERYGWETARQLAQAYGRIARAPTDYGITIIADGAFARFYEQNKQLFPVWFQEAEAGPSDGI